jgi:hypothetical protein
MVHTVTHKFTTPELRRPKLWPKLLTAYRYAVRFPPDWPIVAGEGTDLRGGTVSYATNTSSENSLAQLKNEIACI